MNNLRVSPDKLKGKSLKKHITRKGLFVRLPIPNSLKTLEPEIYLGRTVLDKAVMECFDTFSETNQWFSLDNEDFCTICFIAYLEPNTVITNVTTVLRKIHSPNECP